MSNRLRHSPAGYRRLIQISQAELLVIVEGRTDRFFYHEICTVALGHHGTRFDVRMVSELPVTTGGKPGILQFYDTLRRRSGLVDDFKGKRSVIVFLLDKDVDDVLRTQRRSPHVIYTAVYELENYLFMHTDVIHALAAALRLPRTWVEPLIPDNWQRVAAEAWREWTALCLTVRLLGISAASNYRVTSRLNNPCVAPANMTEMASRMSEIQARSGLSADEFDRVVAHATNVVTRRYAARNHDSVFSGKWYLTFLHYWTLSSGSAFGDDELLSSLLTSLDFRGPWSAHLVERIQELARRTDLIAA